VEILFDDQPVLAVGANSRWARRRKIDLSELVDEPWVATPPETLPTMAMEQAFKASNLPRPRIRVTTFSLQLRMHLLSTGNFLTAMPRSLLRLNVDGIRLKALPVKLPINSFPVAVVTLKNRTQARWYSCFSNVYVHSRRRMASPSVRRPYQWLVRTHRGSGAQCQDFGTERKSSSRSP